MNNIRRVVVTGIGLVSSLGIGTEANWAGIKAGQSGIDTITKFDTTQFATRIAGEVKHFDPLAYIDKKDVKKMDIFIQYAIAASQFAMDDSGLTITPELSRRVGVFIASGIGGFTTIEREHKALLEGGPRKISPFFIPSAIINLAAGQVSIRFGARGPNSATCTACSASAHAIGDAFEIIKRGAADVMIAGGSEAAITPMGIGGFGALLIGSIFMVYQYTQQAGGVLKLATSHVHHPDATLLGLATAVAAEPASLLRAVHFFPFGALAATAAWATDIRDGRFEVDDRVRLRVTA